MRVLVMLSQVPPLGVSARRGARTQVWLASTPDVEHSSGKYFHGHRARRSSRISYDPAAQRRLWDASEVLLSRSGNAPGADV
jgi:hypothetical protein